jgi:outer membrane protein assembly factor BamB
MFFVRPELLMKRIVLVNTSLLICLLMHSTTVAEDWPRWRGPRGNGTWNAPRLSSTFPKQGLKQLWKRTIGGGYSGVTVAGDRVFVTDRMSEPKEIERINSFHLDTGQPAWQFSYRVAYGDLDYGTGPRAAPTVHDNRVYILGAIGNLFCLDAGNGTVLWSVDLQKDFSGRVPTWGYAASPLIYKNNVIVQPGGSANGSIVALNRETGKVHWKNLSDEAAYATPILFEHNKQTQLVCWTPSHIRALNPENGTLLWSVPYKVQLGVSIATPIFHRNTLLVSGYWKGTKAIRLGSNPAEAKLIWEETRNLNGLMSQPLYKDGYGYLLDKTRGLICFELQTGKKLWDDKNRMTPRGRNPQASLVWLNDADRAIILNSDGELILARLNPDGYHEQSRTKIIGQTWAHPAYASNKIIARSDTELICYELPVVE